MVKKWVYAVIFRKRGEPNSPTETIEAKGYQSREEVFEALRHDSRFVDKTIVSAKRVRTVE